MAITNQIPDYFREKYQLIYTVTFAAFFSIVFLLLSLPFSHNSWMALGNSKFFAFTVLFAAGSLTFVALSRYLMYRTRKVLRMTYLGYVAWCVAEVIIICLAYSFITVPITGIGWDQFPKTLGNALLYGVISLIIPYILAGMYFALQDKNLTDYDKKRLKKRLKELNELYAEMQKEIEEEFKAEGLK